MGKIKAGTYRQIVLASEDWENYDDDELIEDARAIIRDAFGLTPEQADKIEMECVMPTYRKIKSLAEELFVARVAEIPNAEGPANSNEPGQS
jgi:hypothetical protein